MEHTPGPWSPGEDGDIYTVNATKSQNGFNNPRIAEILTDAFTDAEAQANRNIMTAAPVLLEACQIASWELRGGRGVPIDRQRIANELEQAIAKATGRE